MKSVINRFFVPGLVLSGLTPEMKERGFWEVSTKSETERRLVREIKAKEASEELLVSCDIVDPPLRKLQREYHIRLSSNNLIE